MMVGRLSMRTTEDAAICTTEEAVAARVIIKESTVLTCSRERFTAAVAATCHRFCLALVDLLRVGHCDNTGNKAGAGQVTCGRGRAG